jgi:hypothetical protein
MEQRIPVPIDGRGHYDYAKMKALGTRLRRIEAAQAAVRRSLENVLAARVTIDSLLTDDEKEPYELPAADVRAVAEKGSKSPKGRP